MVQGSRRRAALKLATAYAARRQALFERDIAGDGVGLVGTVPEHCVGAGLLAEFGDDRGCGTAPQDERQSDSSQGRVERRQAVVQPPPAGSTNSPLCRSSVIEYVERQYRSLALCRRRQCGVVGKTQVLAQPQDGRRARGHATITSDAEAYRRRDDVRSPNGPLTQTCATRGGRWMPHGNIGGAVCVSWSIDER